MRRLLLLLLVLLTAGCLTTRPRATYLLDTPALPDYERSLDHAGLIASLDRDAVGRGMVTYRTACYSCHGEQVQMKNVRLDSPELIKQHAQNVYQQVVVTKQMPMNNATGITDEERALIGRWFQSGAKVD